MKIQNSDAHYRVTSRPRSDARVFPPIRGHKEFPMRKDDLDRIEKWAARSLTLLLILISCGPAAVAQSTTFNANGAFASVVDFCSESQTSIEQCILLEVFTGSTNGQKTTLLDYDLLIFTDPSTGAFQEASGFGFIPNSSFQVHGQNDSLNVDTSKVPDFFNGFCTFDPITGNTTCNSAPGGVVIGTWTAITNLLTSQSSGTNRTTFPNLISAFSGTFDSLAALANVNVLGAAFANATASVGTSHTANISVQARH
jgi:hypothetical protein